MGHGVEARERLVRDGLKFGAIEVVKRCIKVWSHEGHS